MTKKAKELTEQQPEQIEQSEEEVAGAALIKLQQHMLEKTHDDFSLFTANLIEPQIEAIITLITGKTPVADIRWREARGGGQVRYVNTYYMTRMMNLLTRFRWKAECLEEKTRTPERPVEVMAKMKVTYWDDKGREYSQTSWGSKDISRSRRDSSMISFGDDLKAAYSDGIKKCLSYFGIADDIYGSKEGEVYEPDDDGTGNKGNDEASTDEQRLKALVSKHKLPWSKAFKLLGIKSLTEITDYIAAFEKMQKHLEGGEQAASTDQPY